jgi:hypothetical protein
MHTARGQGDETIAPHYKNDSKYVNENATVPSGLSDKERQRQSQRVQDNAPEGVDLSHEGIVNHYASAADEPDPDLIDPEYEPFPGEPDPDLRPEENEEWWRQRRNGGGSARLASHLAEFAPAADCYTAGYFDGMRSGAQSSFRNHLVGGDLTSYDAGLRAGLASHYEHDSGAAEGLRTGTVRRSPTSGSRTAQRSVQPSPWGRLAARSDDEYGMEPTLQQLKGLQRFGSGDHAYTDGPDPAAVNPGNQSSNPFMVPGDKGEWGSSNAYGSNGSAPPSSGWMADHGPYAPNPADSGPPGFGNAADPESYLYQDNQDLPDERLLSPGPAITHAWGGASTTASLRPRAPQRPQEPMGHTALAPAAHLDPMTAQALLDEGIGIEASNLTALDLVGSHYVTDAEDRDRDDVASRMEDEPWWC